jgi:hypothetical protein
MENGRGQLRVSAENDSGGVGRADRFVQRGVNTVRGARHRPPVPYRMRASSLTHSPHEANMATSAVATEAFLEHLASSPTTRHLAQSLGFVVGMRRVVAEVAATDPGAEIIDLMAYRSSKSPARSATA